MSYTLGEAARATDRNKTTIQRAIQSGKISATRNEDGIYTIDPVELHRVFPATPDYRPTTVAVQHHATDHGTLAVLEERVRHLEQWVCDLVEQRDGWQNQAERLALLLTASQPAPVTESQPIEPDIEPQVTYDPFGAVIFRPTTKEDYDAYFPRPWWRRWLKW